MSYIPTIGLEIHAELKTKSKMFCSCKNDPDEEKPNVNICPICLGHPGTLPVLNHEAIRLVLTMGQAVGGKLADFTEWDRKNYFYPDIPKGYQISQYKYPLVESGVLANVDIERIHLEEDTAQSTHDTSKKTLINFNRSGVPLMELVTKPVIHDGATAVNFAKELQMLLRYIGAGDANLEKGEMRVEANISIASEEDTKNKKFGTKTEVKNLNSFRAVEKAIAYEIDRQTSLLDEGMAVTQETRGWDDVRGETYSQRSKESSHDYRYFPDPDIPKLKISEIAEFSPAALAESMGELPAQKRERFKKDFAMTEKEVAVFVDNHRIAAYYEQVIAPFRNDARLVKLSTNYILTDYLGLLKKKPGISATEIETGIGTIPAAMFSELIIMTGGGELSSRGAKDLILEMASQSEIASQGSVKKLAEKMGLLQQSNAENIEPAIDEVIKNNAKVVAEYKGGKAASLQFLIGQAMKATKGAANPAVVKELLVKKLG